MSKYFLTDNEAFETEEDCAQYIIENADGYDDFDDFLNMESEVSILGYDFDPAEVLKELDPIAYDCEYSDYMDSQYSDILERLENMEEGETETFFGIEVEAHEYLDEEI